MDKRDELYAESFGPLYDKIRTEYAIDQKNYRSESIKRGLRNSDGSAVLVGVTKIGSVQGYLMVDGERWPISIRSSPSGRPCPAASLRI